MLFALTKSAAQRASNVSTKKTIQIIKQEGIKQTRNRIKRAFTTTQVNSSSNGINGYKSIQFKPSELQGLTNPIQNLVTSCPKKNGPAS